MGHWIYIIFVFLMDHAASATVILLNFHDMSNAAEKGRVVEEGLA